MLILSSSTSFLTLRVSSSLSSSPSISSSFAASYFPLFLSCAPSVRSFSSPSSFRSRRNKCPYVVLYSSASPMAEMVDDAVAVPSEDNMDDPSRSILDIDSEEGLLTRIEMEAQAGRLPPNTAAALIDLYHNYHNAVTGSRIPNAKEVIISNNAAEFNRVLFDAQNPFEFPSYHKAVREPFDYYMFGQNFIRPLINFSESYVGNISLFHEIEEKLNQGHNVILFSNHQTEADPAIIALLLEKTHSHIAENMTYVAGDRVVTDPLCKPFSMGRNLICVYSKKHMFDVPELADMKRKANIRSLKEMAVLLRGGSQIVWIAPSGGRDRSDPETGECFPASFDPSSVDNMTRLALHSGVPGHIFPLALLCYDIMPPPPQVEKEIGEKRLVAFHGAGLSVASEISFQEVVAAHEDPEKAKVAYQEALYNSVTEQYNVLKSAIYGKEGLAASIPSVSLSQPWA